MKYNEVNPRWADLDESVKPRIKVEIDIVAKVLRAVRDTGNWTLWGVDLDEGIEETPTFEDAMKLIFDLDDARVYFTNKRDGSNAWVYFVFGNDTGHDVINDWTLSGDGFREVLDRIALAGEYDNGDEEV